MELVKKYNIKTLINKLIGNKVHFTSDCELFPNFNIKCKVISYDIANNGEYVFNVKTIPSNKNLKVGLNMKNLKFEIIKT